MSTPLDSTKPATFTSSTPAVVGGKEAIQRLSEEVSGFIGGMSPAGATVYDTGWITGPDLAAILTMASGWTLDAGSSRIRRVGSVVSMYIRATRTGSAVIINAGTGVLGGSITATPLGTLAAPWNTFPGQVLSSGASRLIGGFIQGGTIVLSAATGSTSIATGEAVAIGGPVLL